MPFNWLKIRLFILVGNHSPHATMERHHVLKFLCSYDDICVLFCIKLRLNIMPCAISLLRILALIYMRSAEVWLQDEQSLAQEFMKFT